MDPISIALSIPAQRIADLICTGFEGGMSQHWLRVKEVVQPKGHDEPPLSFSIEFVPLHGGKIVCYDYNDERKRKKRLTIDSDSIYRGLCIMAKKFPYQFGLFLSENEDAITGDVFLQCCLLGDVLYS